MRRLTNILKTYQTENWQLQIPVDFAVENE
jgi:hypothetical protein